MSTHMIAQTSMHAEDRPVIATPMFYARLAGVLYLIITFAAIVAHMYVPSTLIVPNDAAATVANITASEGLFRMGGLGAELIVLLSEVILSIILYMLLKPVNNTLSLIATVSRLIMTTIHGINLLNYAFVLFIINGAAFGIEQSHALVSLFLDAHSFGFTVGIAFLIIHVFALGYLIYQSGYFPRVLGILFLIAGFGYLFDTVGLLFIESYTTTPDLIAMLISVAEIAFPVWLLVKGLNLQKWQQRMR
ncbi:DUF4386 domain-containing protein [Phototrophicus methaneseepsis]|uniref:DUF4386 domain-containing protein n=1 Tax=Phototrophicus methaneseepsis TaxID=2710758 RepID=A0A7S8IFM0_9CHLR|nr:DUF4386 domain-containing protein [Phototrophicus methaneseepsis]QPC83746.1 DUF4386 domain-containing protein [Phototrophicus methaneseepsis]